MKAQVTGAGGDQTEHTRVFDIVRAAPWPARYPGRALRNEFSRRWHGREDILTANQKNEEQLYLAADSEDFRIRVVSAGEGVDLVKDVPSAHDLIERIVAEAAAVLLRGAALVRTT